MKKLFIIFAIMVLSGCSEWNHLTGNENKQKKPSYENAGGVWMGTIKLDGTDRNITFTLIQKESSITYGYSTNDHSFVTIDWGSTLHAVVTGTVLDHSINMTATQGSSCPNPWTFSGEIREGNMLLSVNTDGNANCYPNPVHETIVVAR